MNSAPITPDQLLNLFRNIGVYSRDGRRAVHKPMLLLMALARVQGGLGGKFMFHEIEESLNALITKFGTTGISNAPKAHYPFWYLRSDGFWEIDNCDDLRRRTGKSSEPTVTALRERAVVGGFTDSVSSLLMANPGLVEAAAQELLSGAFPTSLHLDVLLSIGLDGEFCLAATKRDSRFRDQVLQAYSYCCAVCGFDGRLGATSVAVEAAHIRWVQYGGPNRVNNGIALCSLHHKVFDMGGFTVNPEGQTLIVSKSLNGLSEPVRTLFRLHGSRIHCPSSPEDLALPAHLKWHQSQIFRLPGLAAS